MIKTALSVMFLLGLTQRAQAWKAESHLIVAKIAYDMLSDNHPDVLQSATKLLKVFSTAHPDKVPKEGSYPFVECATYADDTRRNVGAYQGPWHFVDTPYYDNGNAQKYNEILEPHNVTLAISDIMDWLREVPGYQLSYVYGAMMKQTYQFKSENEAKSVALRLLIHYLGDIHQPLHCSTRVDDDYPDGDKGGNDFSLPYHYAVNNLHSLWDSVMYEFHDSMKLPFDATSWLALGAHGTILTSTYSIPAGEQRNMQYSKWATDSYSLASQNAYKGIDQDEAVPQEYIDRTKPLAERQLVLAGKRLAYLMTKAFATSATTDDEDT